MPLRINLFVFILPEFQWVFMCTFVFHKIWEDFSNYFFNVFCFFPYHFSPNSAIRCMLIYVPMFCNSEILFSFPTFFFLYLNYIMFINPSLISHILSSVYENQLLNNCSEFVISIIVLSTTKFHFFKLLFLYWFFFYLRSVNKKSQTL